jgi:D-alanyl-D-alanine carboxypeptidase
VFGLAAMLAVSVAAGNADARSRRHHHAVAHEAYDPPYASIVVDANSGTVMQATNADSPRHPASLTKIMTLYLLFERLEAGKIKMSTEMSVSPHAAAQAPSKLGLKPGETISVESAIRAIVTKSANDVAVVIAETLGGSEEEFAKHMTAKARALGMMHTVFRDASGLPNDEQITTASDMAILGRAINDRFPQYYSYFSTRSFAFRGRVIRGHNRLLGSVDGVDGIKTGYINASGFNIVTSVHRNNRHIVAIVFGGHTAEARDARVRSLIANNINVASAKRTAPPVVEGWAVAEARKDAAEKPANVKTAAATPLPPAAAPVAGSTDPIRPNPVKTFAVQPGGVRSAALSPQPSASRKLMPATATANPASITTITTVKSEPTMPDEIRAQAIEVASASDSVPIPVAAPDAKPEKAAKSHGDWTIQVGAFDSETEAHERLSTVGNSNAKELLGRANPLTERVTKGDKTLYRARFAGLEKSQAETVCKNLKRSDIPCMLLRN